MDDDNLSLHRMDPLTIACRQDLDPLSIAELDARIAALKQEIGRCEMKKAASSNHMSVADALFKKS